MRVKCEVSAGDATESDTLDICSAECLGVIEEATAKMIESQTPGWSLHLEKCAVCEEPATVRRFGVSCDADSGHVVFDFEDYCSDGCYKIDCDLAQKDIRRMHRGGGSNMGGPDIHTDENGRIADLLNMAKAGHVIELRFKSNITNLTHRLFHQAAAVYTGAQRVIDQDASRAHADIEQLVADLKTRIASLETDLPTNRGIFSEYGEAVLEYALLSNFFGWMDSGAYELVLAGVSSVNAVVDTKADELVFVLLPGWDCEQVVYTSGGFLRRCGV